MVSECPVCGTKVENPESDKCSHCDFPLIRTNDGETKFHHVLKEDVIKKIEDWGRNLYRNKFANQCEPSGGNDYLNLQSENMDVIATINSFNNSFIPKIEHFLEKLHSILFVDINTTNRNNLYHILLESRQYYEQLRNLILQLKNKELMSLIQIDNLHKSFTDTNWQSKHDLQQISLSQPQLEEELHKQIAPLQNQIQQLVTLLTPFLQTTIAQSDITPVESEAIHKNTHHSVYIQESQTQSTENIRQDSDTSNTNLPHIPWLKAYNQNPESFEQHQPILLSITDESIHQCRLGSSQPIILGSTKKGNYWIFPEDNTGTSGKYLVPKANLKINEYGLETMKFLFKISEGDVGNYTKLKVISPALVIPIEHDKWQLEAQGILQFESD